MSERTEIKGDVYTITPSKWARVKPEIGHYTGRGDFKVSERKCPYCEDPMVKMTAHFDTPHRIAKILKQGKVKWKILGHAIPESHDIFLCLACEVEFTSPKDFLERLAP